MPHSGKIDPTSPAGRAQSLKGLYMVDTVRGKIRVRSWPKPRGPNRNETNKWWSEWLRQAMALAKYAPSKELILNRAAVKDLPVKPTDLYLQAMRGTLWVIQVNNYGTLYPRQARDKVSKSLDVITQTYGDMLVRGDTVWQGVDAPIAEGMILRASGLLLPEWSTLADAGIAEASTGAVVTRTTIQTISNLTSVSVIFSTAETDDGNPAYWNSGTPTRLTVAQTGWYQIGANTEWSTNTAGFRALDLRANGATEIAGVTTDTVAGELVGNKLNVSLVRHLTAGDYIEARVFQSSGGILNMLNASMYVLHVG